jgi:WS/DGAT/MGAT family acyltransferase
VNDIVVAAVTSGFRDLLLERGESVENRTLTAMVPVSLRQPAERGETGNRVANVHARLPLGIADPITRMRMVQNHLRDLKHSHETEATGFVMNIGNYVPRPIADRLARAIVQRQRSVETVITNVPGPQSSVHLGASRLIGAYPIAPIAGLVRITVAVWSYHGHLYIGITADQNSVPDIETLARGIGRGFETLVGIN